MSAGADAHDHGEALAHGVLEQGLAGGGALRWALTDLSEVVETARRRLDLSPVAAAAMGRSLAAAALLLRMASKTPTRLVLEICGSGPLRHIVAEADADGNLRGMVGAPQADVPSTADGKLAVGAGVGSGLLRVAREYQGGSYHSQVKLVSGEIGEDVAHFLAQSEQTRSAVLLGVLARPHGVAAAGGMIVEVMPEAPEEAVARLEANLEGFAGVSRLLEEDGPQGTLERVLAGLDAVVGERRQLAYRCRCSRQRLLRHLVLLARQGEKLVAGRDEPVEAECTFCGAAYRFLPAELSGGDGTAAGPAC